MRNRRISVVGGGPAGLAAAMEAQRQGAVATIFDRLDHPGGILNQCIHSGFGLRLYGEEWTGPEFAEHLVAEALASGVKISSGCEVVALHGDKTLSVRSERGLETIANDAVVLANGCWERNRGPLLLPGTRPSGIFSAGEAQQWVNLHGYLPGKRILILGSGDIGLIMARRLVYEGAEVLGVVEINPYASGNSRNRLQCLEENGIPLWLEHSAIEVHGRERLEAVTIARVKEGKVVEGSERRIYCDTLLLSVGLVPENELAREVGIELDSNTGGALVDQARATSLAGFYACGNALQVHDLADNAVLEGRIAGCSAARGWERGEGKRIHGEGNLRYVLPQILTGCSEPFTFYLRVRQPAKAVIRLLADGEVLLERHGSFTPSGMVEVKTDKALLSSLLAARKVLFTCGD